MRRLMIAALVLGSFVAARNLQTKGTQTAMAHSDAITEMTEAIRARLTAQWEGWKNQDPRPNDAIIVDDFQSFSADGIHRMGRPTTRQMAEQPIAGYKLSEFRALPVGMDEALVTYFAEIKTPDNAEHHMFVGEAWVKREGQWKIRGFSGTLLK
ncbi:MAG TPA: nuclear transport factor 2 family protein [Candidatus Limnocylindrales bacterium]|nr:nuclear transport factor 2 family protein [Candidatus Limnocylindrales bacterium]